MRRVFQQSQQVVARGTTSTTSGTLIMSSSTEVCFNLPLFLTRQRMSSSAWLAGVGRRPQRHRRLHGVDVSTTRMAHPLAAVWNSVRWSSTTSSSSGGGDTALLRLLQDPDDPYLHSIQKLDLLEIVETMKRGPTAAVVAAQLRRPKVLKEAEPCVFPAPSFSSSSPAEKDGADAAAAAAAAAAAGQESESAPSSLSPSMTPSSASAGAAVLEGLRVHGMARQHQVLVEEAEAAERQRQENETAQQGASEEERAAAAAAAAVQHTWEGLCAVNAALRMLLEALIGDDGADGNLREVLPSKEVVLDAAYEAFCFVYTHYKTEWRPPVGSAEEAGGASAFIISPQQWQEDYVEELKDLREMFQAAGDPREILLE